LNYFERRHHPRFESRPTVRVPSHSGSSAGSPVGWAKSAHRRTPAHRSSLRKKTRCACGRKAGLGAPYNFESRPTSAPPPWCRGRFSLIEKKDPHQRRGSLSPPARVCPQPWILHIEPIASCREPPWSTTSWSTTYSKVVDHTTPPPGDISLTSLDSASRRSPRVPTSHARPVRGSSGERA
jgi:hypothetical protein